MKSNTEYCKTLLATDPNNETYKELLKQSIAMDTLVNYPQLINLDILTEYTYEDLIEDGIIEADDMPKKAYEFLQEYFLGD